MMSAVAGCTVSSDGCSWVREIYVADEDRLTRQTEDRIIAHNMKVAEFCR